MRNILPDGNTPSKPGMLALGVAMILGSAIRLIVGAAFRAIAGKSDPR